jgi:hypothetical protein
MSDQPEANIMKPNMALMRGPFKVIISLTLMILIVLILFAGELNLSFDRCLRFEGPCVMMGLIVLFFAVCLGHLYIRSAITVSTSISDDGIRYLSCCGMREMKFSDVKRIKILKGIYTGFVIELIDGPHRIRFSLGLFDDKRLINLLKTKIDDSVPEKGEMLEAISSYEKAKKS